MKNKTLPSSDKVRVKRGHQRGHYDRETVNTILDSGYLANIAYIFNSEPFVTVSYTHLTLPTILLV